jgi:hypothetical protein
MASRYAVISFILTIGLVGFNGSITANDHTQSPEEAAQGDFSVFRKMKWGPFDLPAAHIFKIKNGQICDIEALGYIAEHGIKNGW